jgi:CheY-like chemotaxis protein
VTGPRSSRILLAERSERSVRDFRRKIGRWRRPCELIVARDERAARELLDPASAGRLPALPDVVVLDVEMPRAAGIEGAELLDFIRRSDWTRHLPVIVLTASGARPGRGRAANFLVDDYLPKGATAEALCAVIERNIGEGNTLVAVSSSKR